MFPLRHLLFTSLLLSSLSVFGADPPALDAKKPPPLADLILELKDGDREDQVFAAEKIRDHYAGKCLDAIPQMAASMGRELNRPHEKNKGRAYLLTSVIGEAAQTAGSGRFKVLLELTADKDPLVRAGAFFLLYTASGNYQRVYYDSKEKSELPLTDLLAACQKGVKDESVLVRTHAVVSLGSFHGGEQKLVTKAVGLLADALEDRKTTDTQSRSPAIEAANTLLRYGAEGKPALKALAKAAASEEDAQAAAMSCYALGGLAYADKALAPEIVEVLRAIYADTKRKPDFRTPAINAIGYTGRAGEAVIADLVKVLDEPEVTDFTRHVVYRTCKQLGASAAKAVPALVKALEGATSSKESSEILLALQAIGPAAGEAIKQLEKWMEGMSDKRMKQLAEKTINAIK